MADIQWFRIKPFLYLLLFVGILNSYLMYSLAQGFFSQEVRLFLFIVFNQIYAFIGILTIYVYAKINNLERENNELKYIIKSISKRYKKK